MKKIILLMVLLSATGFTLINAQVNAGSIAAADNSAMLQVSSTTSGFRPPHVSLTATSPAFGLTVPTSVTQAYGMIVYDSSTATTGITAYPTHGAGNYWWDSTGWVSFAYKNPTELVTSSPYVGIFITSSDTVSSSIVADNTLTGVLALSNITISTASVKITGGDSLEIITPGTYRINVDCAGVCTGDISGTKPSNQAIFTTNMYNATGTVLASESVVQAAFSAGSTTQNVDLDMVFSYVNTFTAGYKIYFKAITEGIPSGFTDVFVMQSLHVERIQ